MAGSQGSGPPAECVVGPVEKPSRQSSTAAASRASAEAAVGVGDSAGEQLGRVGAVDGAQGEVGPQRGVGGELGQVRAARPRRRLSMAAMRVGAERGGGGGGERVEVEVGGVAQACGSGR